MPRPGDKFPPLLGESPYLYHKRKRPMQLLDHHQIQQKVKRLAIEILEHNTEEEELILAGINNRGMKFAELLTKQLQQLSAKAIHLTHLTLSPANPLEQPVVLDMPVQEVKGKPFIIVDDVANTGRTLFYACQPIMSILPRKIEIAVLVDRTHKSFPIRPDYIGLSLATTLREDIDVQIMGDEWAVYLR
jgi:pyrimidine operon attenuation protein/uracil phosphoribosyltransferase